MRLTCPCCGAQVSAEAWQNDASVRQFMVKLVGLPDRIQGLALPYLGLFRKVHAKDGACASKGLAWSRALRILSDLVDLVDAGTVHWDGGEERPCHPNIWFEALQTVLQRRPKELENHNYLRRVAWEMASSLAGHAERGREHQRRQSTRTADLEGGSQDVVNGPEGAEDPPPQGDGTPLTDEERRVWWAQMKDALNKVGS